MPEDEIFHFVIKQHTDFDQFYYKEDFIFVKKNVSSYLGIGLVDKTLVM